MSIFLEKLSDFNVVKVNVEESRLKLHIKVSSNKNLKEYEKDIKSRFPDYIVSILFFMEDNKVKSFKKVIGISSGKGGVGKSLIALNLALTMKKLGYSVGILDADIYSPSIPGLLNLKQAPESIDGNLIETVKWGGIEVLSMALMLKDNQSPMWKDSMISSAFNQFLVQGNWTCDYLIIDFAASMNSAYEMCASIMPNAEMLLIGSPNKMVYRDVLRMYALLKSMNFKVLGMINNMSYMKCSQCSHKEEFACKFNLEGLNILYDLPYFNHFHSIIESGYAESYELGDEYDYFKDVVKLVI